jgi:hypothetical protein
MSEQTISERLIEGMVIIERWFGRDKCSISAEHDQIYFGPDDWQAPEKNPLPPFHKKRLEDMGWMVEDYGWSIFV